MLKAYRASHMSHHYQHFPLFQHLHVQEYKEIFLLDHHHPMCKHQYDILQCTESRQTNCKLNKITSTQLGKNRDVATLLRIFPLSNPWAGIQPCSKVVLYNKLYNLPLFVLHSPSVVQLQFLQFAVVFWVPTQLPLYIL